MFDFSFINWSAVGTYTVGGLIWLSAIPVTYVLIKYLNRLEVRLKAREERKRLAAAAVAEELRLDPTFRR